jgi:DNA polymerase III epsilon subunit-like protein
MLSVGAVEVVRGDDGWKPGESLYLELQPLPGAGDDPGAAEVHGLDTALLAREGMEPGEAMRELRSWSLERSGGREPVFVGHNAPFDWSFISWYFVRFGVENPYGYKALDTKAMAMGALRLPWFDTHKERLARELEGLPAEDMSQKHRADYDAAYQARILCALLGHLGL